ncbi:MAG: hypothetical protein ACHQF0_16855 [Chitinophagales bacterium]
MFFRNPTVIIVLLACLQVLSSTYFLNIPNFYAINSFIFLLSGLGISICLLKVSPAQIQVKKIINRQLLLKLFIIALLLPISYQFARHIMDDTPLQYQDADMLPIMKVMGQRFWNGQWKQVYQPIPEIWNGIKPIYLPAMWLPFSFSIVFHFDIRWITVCGIWLGIILCVLPAWKKGWQIILIAAALLTLLTWLHTDDDNSVIELTEEGVVFFYYALLTTAIILRNPWLLGISIALCLLSRYSFIGWIPFGVVFLLARKEYSFLLKTITAFFVIMLVLVLPFGISPLLDHLQLQHDYISHAARVWHDNPEFYYNGLGMAKFFGPTHIKSLHFILEGGTFLIPLVFLFLVRKKISIQPNILLAGFQLSLTFFYNFLDVTYLYLYYTPVFVSLVIANWSLYRKQTPVSA